MARTGARRAGGLSMSGSRLPGYVDPSFCSINGFAGVAPVPRPGARCWPLRRTSPLFQLCGKRQKVLGTELLKTGTSACIASSRLRSVSKRCGLPSSRRSAGFAVLSQAAWSFSLTVLGDFAYCPSGTRPWVLPRCSNEEWE